MISRFNKPAAEPKRTLFIDEVQWRLPTMTTSDPVKAWDIAESIGTCFFGTGLHQYPMSAIVRREEGVIYFLTDARSEKISELKLGSHVQLTFSDTSANDYLFIEGNASVSDNRRKIIELWNPFAKAWWDSAEDPNIRLVTFSPNRAEFWDGPNRLLAVSKMLFAAATGNRPDLGDNGETKM